MADKLLLGITENPDYWRRLEAFFEGEAGLKILCDPQALSQEEGILEDFCPQNMSSSALFLLVFSSMLCLPCPCAENDDAMWNTT